MHIIHLLMLNNQKKVIFILYNVKLCIITNQCYDNEYKESCKQCYSPYSTHHR